MKRDTITLEELELHYHNLYLLDYKPKIFTKIRIEVFPIRHNSLFKSFSLNIQGEFNEYNTTSNNFDVFFENEIKIDEYFKNFKKIRSCVYFMGNYYYFTLKRGNSLIEIDRHYDHLFGDNGVNSHIRLKLDF